MPTRRSGGSVLAAMSVDQQPVADRRAVAECYLAAELGKLFGDDDPAVAGAVRKTISGLDTHDLWRLLEALSFTYRANGIFFLATSRGMDWHEAIIPVGSLALGGVSPQVNEVTGSPRVKRSPERFATYLAEYFAAHPGDDPEGLGEFRPRGCPVAHATIIAVERERKIWVADGTHRLMEMIHGGTQAVQAYCAVPNGRRSYRMAGDATFIRLAMLFRRYARPEQREAILAVTGMLARMSTDGRQAIQAYWIDHASTPSVKQAGARLLAR